MAPPNALDYEAIRNTLSLYCHALDTKNFSLLDQVFVPNVHAKYPFREAMTGTPTIADAIANRYEALGRCA